MNRSSIFHFALAILLCILLASCFRSDSALAQTSTGVSIGDWAIYNIEMTVNGTVPAPSQNLVSTRIDVLGVSETNITLHTVVFSEDNSTHAGDYVLDVESAQVYNSTVLGEEFSWLIPSNLSAGDNVNLYSIGDLASPSTLGINETIDRQYINTTVQVNHLNFTYYSRYSYAYDLYYVKATGMLAEMSLNYTLTMPGSTEHVERLYRYRIAEASVISEFSFLLMVPLFAAMTLAAIVYKKISHSPTLS